MWEIKYIKRKGASRTVNGWCYDRAYLTVWYWMVSDECLVVVMGQPLSLGNNNNYRVYACSDERHQLSFTKPHLHFISMKGFGVLNRYLVD